MSEAGPMRNVLYGVLGRASLGFELLRRLKGDRWHRTTGEDQGEMDRTGRVVEESAPMGFWERTPDLAFPRYESLGQSFWRAQELTLLHRHRGQLAPPVADFGCGDGSFASMIFDRMGFGIDIDAQALAMARERGPYATLVQTDGRSIPLPDCSVGSFFSNSVLEHAVHLEETVGELRRILKPGGIGLATVPVKQFERDLAKYFGRRESRQINWDFYHRNLLEPGQWKALFERVGFMIRTIHPYQPDYFTFWFRMLRLSGKRGLARVLPAIQETIWDRYGTFLISMVRDSVNGTEKGGNILLIVQKPPENDQPSGIRR